MRLPKILFVSGYNKYLPFAAKEIAVSRFSTAAEFDWAFFDFQESIELDIKKLQLHGVDTSLFRERNLDDVLGEIYDLLIILSEDTVGSLPQFPGFPVVINWGRKFGRENFSFEAWTDTFEQELSTLENSGYIKGIHQYKYNVDMVINSLGDAVISHDLNRKLFYFNSTAEKLTGYSQEEVLGKDCHDIFPAPLCGQNCSFCAGECLGNEFKGKSYTTSFYDRSGVRKECKVHVIPMRDHEGNLKGVTASIRDLTELEFVKQQILKEQNFNGIVGKSPNMLQVFQQIRDLGIYDAPVHIHGETGTGKELVARAIHNESHRKTEPFVPINCGALPEGLIESELFGHVKGSFSGALRDKKGRFELAHKGTIFLDEIGDLSKSVQVKLLRFLQEGTLEKVGSEKDIEVDVRIISATNKDLKKAVKDGEFREDLYYRLNVVPVVLPPLRERKQDISILCEHFLDKISKRYDQKKLSISREALSLLLDYGWPGNVRELENVMEYAVIHCSGSMIIPDNFPLEITERVKIDNSENEKPDISPASGKLNREAVLYALEKSGGNKSKAAKILGVGRATLYRFLAKNRMDTD